MLPDHEFVKATSLSAVLDALESEQRSVKLLAGGTDVIFNMRGRLFVPELLLSLRDVDELKGVAELADGSLAMGSACRLTDLENHPLVAQWAGLVAGFRAVASRHVRNMATLGGNLNLDTRCWYTNQTEEWRKAKGPCLKTGEPCCHAIKSSDICVALNASDTAPVLMALDAMIELASAGGVRSVPLRDFYTDDGIAHTVRRPDEVMTRVIVPPASDRVVYIKETARKGNDFAYATIAARADGQGEDCTKVSLILGSIGTQPLQLVRTAAILSDKGLGEAALEEAVSQVRDELGVLTNLYTPAAYKSRIARTLVRDAVRRLRSGRES
jgi:4-hydroxybenzoyl-CoA reductase subunit beta